MNTTRSVEESGKDFSASTFESSTSSTVAKFLADVENYKLRNETHKSLALESVLPKIIGCVKYLNNPENKKNTCDEDALQGLCMGLLCKEDELQKSLLAKHSYLTSNDIQKNLLSTMADMCLKAIVKCVKDESGIYGLVVDWTNDLRPAACISVRYVTKNYEVKERFLGCVEHADSSLNLAIVDFLTKLQLPLENLRAQTYGGYFFMSERFNECKLEMKKLQPLADLTYSNVHITQLIASKAFYGRDFAKAFYCVKMFNNLCREFGLFKDLIKGDGRDHILTLRPVHPGEFHEQLEDVKRILDNYSRILDTLEEGSYLGSYGGTEASTIRTMLEDSKHVMDLCAAKPILEMLEALPTYGVIENGIVLVKKQLSTLRTAESFDKIFGEAQRMIESLCLEELTAPRRKISKTDEYMYHEEDQLSVETFYRNKFFAAIDRAVSSLDDFFNSPDFKEYKELAKVLLTGVLDQKIIRKYPELSASDLKIELRKYICKYRRGSVFGHMNVFSKMSQDERCQFQTVEKLVKILMISPASCCETNQSFTDVLKLNNWLRYSSTNESPHHNPVSYVHYEMLNAFSDKDVAKEFLNQVNI